MEYNPIHLTAEEHAELMRQGSRLDPCVAPWSPEMAEDHGIVHLLDEKSLGGGAWCGARDPYRPTPMTDCWRRVTCEHCKKRVEELKREMMESYNL